MKQLVVMTQVDAIWLWERIQWASQQYASTLVAFVIAAGAVNRSMLIR